MNSYKWNEQLHKQTLQETKEAKENENIESNEKKTANERESDIQENVKTNINELITEGSQYLSKHTEIKPMTDKKPKLSNEEQIKNQCILKEMVNKEIISKSDVREGSSQEFKKQSIISKESDKSTNNTLDMDNKLSEKSVSLKAKIPSTGKQTKISDEQQIKNQCILKEMVNKEIISRPDVSGNINQESQKNIGRTREGADNNGNISDITNELVSQKTSIPVTKLLSNDQVKFLDEKQYKEIRENVKEKSTIKYEMSEQNNRVLQNKSLCSEQVVKTADNSFNKTDKSLLEKPVIPLSSMPSFKNIADMYNYESIQRESNTQFSKANTAFIETNANIQEKIVEESLISKYNEFQNTNGLPISSELSNKNVNSEKNEHMNKILQTKYPTSPLCPSKNNICTQKIRTKQDVLTNPCFPKMQFNYHPIQSQKKVSSSNSSLNIEKSCSDKLSLSSSQMSLTSALTVAPEKPFSLATSPVNFSYIDKSSYLPAAETPTTYSGFQPIEIYSKTDKEKHVPIQKPLTPQTPTKPIVEFPITPKPSTPYKRTLSFPPPLPDEISNTDYTKIESCESYKSKVRSPSTPITDEYKFPLHMHIAPRPASTTPKHNIPAVLPVYQTNIATTEHGSVQSNVYNPLANKSGTAVNKFQQPISGLQIINPQTGNMNYDTGCETYHEESKVLHDYDKLTGLRKTSNIHESMRHKEHNKQQISNTSEVKRTPNMITTIDRKRTVKEEYERTQKSKVIEIRTGPDGKVTKHEILPSTTSQTHLSYPPPKQASEHLQQTGQSHIKHHQTLSQTHQSASSPTASAYGPQSLNQYTLPNKTGFPMLKSRSVSAAKTISVPSICDPTPPGAGGVGAPKGGSYGVSTAPKRGRGILNKAALAGSRVPLCGHCNSYVRGPFISALNRIWCPNHFVCSNATCKRPLADIGFVEEQGQLYCEYCFEQYIAPPCDKCHAKIKGDCLNAIGKHFHPECFNCSYCGKLFGNNPFFLEDGQPYCQADWNEMFTTKCFACGFPVEAGDRWVEALSNNYHSQCFNCTMCKKNLEGQSFYAKGGRPFCKNHAR